MYREQEKGRTKKSANISEETRKEKEATKDLLRCNHGTMQFENTDMGSDDDDDDAVTELKPRVKLERQRETRALLAGSNSSLSSSDTRTSRFNDRPLDGSLILAASDCFTTRSSEYNDSNTSTKSDVDTRESVSDGSLFDNSNRSDKNKQNGTKSPKHQRESIKEFFDRRLNRIRSSFYLENPSHNVPLFVSSGKQILAFVVDFEKIPWVRFYLATKRCNFFLPITRQEVE